MMMGSLTTHGVGMVPFQIFLAGMAEGAGDLILLIVLNVSPALQMVSATGDPAVPHGQRNQNHRGANSPPTLEMKAPQTRKNLGPRVAASSHPRRVAAGSEVLDREPNLPHRSLMKGTGVGLLVLQEHSFHEVQGRVRIYWTSLSACLPLLSLGFHALYTPNGAAQA
jgi:hypothetical protein